MARNLKSIDEAVGILNSGGILLLQTDTLPGFHARADNAAGCKRIQDIKGRGEEKPMVVLAADLDQVRDICGDLNPDQEQILKGSWPGPFSFILPAGSRACEGVTGGLHTVAVRIPASAGLRSLISAVGFPLASTSANLSGEPPCETLAEAVSLFSTTVETYWDDNSGTNSPVMIQPSALIDLTVSPPRQLRAGPLPFPKP